MQLIIQCQGSPYSEDNLSIKKFVPGFSFKTGRAPKGSKWTSSYALVTPESCTLFFDSINKSWDSLPPPLRIKPTKNRFEELSEMCALPQCDLVMKIPNVWTDLFQASNTSSNSSSCKK